MLSREWLLTDVSKISPTKYASLLKGQNHWITVHDALFTTTIISPGVENDAPIYSKQPAITWRQQLTCNHHHRNIVNGKKN